MPTYIRELVVHSIAKEMSNICLYRSQSHEKVTSENCYFSQYTYIEGSFTNLKIILEALGDSRFDQGIVSKLNRNNVRVTNSTYLHYWQIEEDSTIEIKFRGFRRILLHMETCHCLTPYYHFRNK